MKIPPEIRTDFNWNEEFNELVVGYPVGAQCESPGACDNEVQWSIDFHGCVQQLACNAHLLEWAQNVNAIIAKYGAVTCAPCDRTFKSPEEMVTLWLV